LAGLELPQGGRVIANAHKEISCFEAAIRESRRVGCQARNGGQDVRLAPQQKIMRSELDHVRRSRWIIRNLPLQYLFRQLLPISAQVMDIECVVDLREGFSLFDQLAGQPLAGFVLLSRKHCLNQSEHQVGLIGRHLIGRFKGLYSGRRIVPGQSDVSGKTKPVERSRVLFQQSLGDGLEIAEIGTSTGRVQKIEREIEIAELDRRVKVNGIQLHRAAEILACFR
jgi:hypothetical protein